MVVESSDPAHAEGDLLLAVPTLAHAGGFAELQLLPTTMVIPLPADVRPEVAVLAQQLGTTIYGMKRFWRSPAAGAAVVLGAGAVGVGLFFTRLCRLASFEQVIVSDLHPHRLEVARQVGSTDTVLAEGDAVAAAVQRLTGTGSRLVVEATGRAHRHVPHAGPGRDDPAVRAALPAAADRRVSWDAQAEPGHASFREGLEAIRSGRVDPTPS